MKTDRGRTTAIIVSSVGVLVLLAGLWSCWVWRQREPAPPRLITHTQLVEHSYRIDYPRGFNELAPEPNLVGQKVRIFAGVIPVKEFFQFVANYSGRMVLEPSDDQSILTREITIASDLREADDQAVRRILEANRIHMIEESLLDGREVLRVVNVWKPLGEW